MSAKSICFLRNNQTIALILSVFIQKYSQLSIRFHR